MENKTFALKGNIVYTKDKNELCINEQSYLVCENGKVYGIYSKLPEDMKDIPVEDVGDKLIIPGLTDLHVHAPQYSFRGLGMDMELLDWLETNTFPEEAKYKDLEYAKKAYGIFAEQMRKSASTRACPLPVFSPQPLPAPYYALLSHKDNHRQLTISPYPGS